MKNTIINRESSGVASASLVKNNLSHVKLWVTGFAAASPVAKRQGRAVPQVFVNTRAVVSRLRIDLSTYAAA